MTADRIAKAIEALAFYAASETYNKDLNTPDECFRCAIDDDEGKKAREALALLRQPAPTMTPHADGAGDAKTSASIAMEIMMLDRKEDNVAALREAVGILNAFAKYERKQALAQQGGSHE